MRQSAITTLAFAAISLVGCAAPADEASSESQEVSGQELKLTVAECGAQQDACLRKNPLFGLFTCPAQYTQCTATASNGLPAEVSAAAADAAACAQSAVRCRGAAGSPAALLACTTTEAECVADIVGVDLPDVVEGTAACVEGALSCIDKARRAGDLSGCAESLAGCAVDQVKAVVPPEVGQVIGDVSDCQVALDTCIGRAETATALAACNEDGAGCVASSLGVTLPKVPVADVVKCTERATSCALDASTVREVTACATGLTSCAADIVGSVDVPAQLTCEQKWTACLTKNALNFLQCGADLSSCRD
jgi:hypothetical protein